MEIARGWSERFIRSWPSALSSKTRRALKAFARSRLAMIDMTASGKGRREDVDDRRIEVEVDDVSEGIASASVRSALYVDLLQLLKTRDGWRIVNVVWRDR